MGKFSFPPFLRLSAECYGYVKILRLIDDLKEAFGASISQQAWIEEEMTQRLLEKVN